MRRRPISWRRRLASTLPLPHLLHRSRLMKAPKPSKVNGRAVYGIDVTVDGMKTAAVAISPVDGVIEALEGIEPQQFVVAVQWHPERSYESSEASRALFAAFLEAARSWESSPPIGASQS